MDDTTAKPEHKQEHRPAHRKAAARGDGVPAERKEFADLLAKLRAGEATPEDSDRLAELHKAVAKHPAPR